MEEQINYMKKQVKVLRTIIYIFGLLFVGLGAYTISTNINSKKLITTEGIIIKDSNDNERILIGTPIPSALNRVRTDSARIWDEWVKRWPENYHDSIWKWYQDYNHTTNGIVILSESGFDRIAIGDPTPDPNIGKRIAPSVGFVIYDEKGFERTGYGVMNFGEKYRVSLGLDSKYGTEGINLVVDDDGYNGLSVPGLDKSIFIGNADTLTWHTKPHNKFMGLIILDRDSVYYSLNKK
ncbi:hypothetical protein ACFLSI_01630 [Bacteroidota bacterium]